MKLDLKIILVSVSVLGITIFGISLYFNFNIQIGNFINNTNINQSITIVNQNITNLNQSIVKNITIIQEENKLIDIYGFFWEDYNEYIEYIIPRDRKVYFPPPVLGNKNYLFGYHCICKNNFVFDCLPPPNYPTELNFNTNYSIDLTQNFTSMKCS